MPRKHIPYFTDLTYEILKRMYERKKAERKKKTKKLF